MPHLQSIGGETERVNLTRVWAAGWSTPFMCSMNPVGLHPRDTDRLIHLLKAQGSREHGGRRRT